MKKRRHCSLRPVLRVRPAQGQQQSPAPFQETSTHVTKRRYKRLQPNGVTACVPLGAWIVRPLRWEVQANTLLSLPVRFEAWKLDWLLYRKELSHLQEGLRWHRCL